MHVSSKIAVPVLRDTMMSPPTLFPHKLRIGAAGFIFKLSTIKTAPIVCTKTSVRNYHCSLRNNTEERSSQEITNNLLNIDVVHI
jgi:hypothetical protein